MLISPPDFLKKKEEEEKVINIDLTMFDMGSSKSSPKKTEEPSPQLPQITKKYQIKADPKEDEMSLEKEKKKKKDSKIKVKKINEEELNKVTLERLLKEVKRRNQKETKKKRTSLMTDDLKKRKKDLEKGLYESSSDTEGLVDLAYNSVLQSWIQKNYSLPEIYEFKNADISAVIVLILDHHGSIVRLKLKESSKNRLFDQLALKTVEKAAPFPTPPKEQVGKEISLNINTKTLE